MRAGCEMLDWIVELVSKYGSFMVGRVGEAVGEGGMMFRVWGVTRDGDDPPFIFWVT